jgi:uncharacterized MAPEG superfamily protein
MTRELFWLTLTVVLTGVMWIPYIIDRIMVRGLMGAMANPSRTDKPHSPWASRMLFAHENAAENLAIFAPLVLVLNALRTLAFAVGFGAQAVLALAIFKAV